MSFPVLSLTSAGTYPKLSEDTLAFVALATWYFKNETGLRWSVGCSKVGFAVWTEMQLCGWLRASVRQMLKPLCCGQRSAFHEFQYSRLPSGAVGDVAVVTQPFHEFAERLGRLLQAEGLGRARIGKSEARDAGSDDMKSLLRAVPEAG